MANDNPLQVILPSDGQVFAQPVQQVGPSPASILMKGISAGLEVFTQSRNANSANKRAAEAAAKKAQDEATETSAWGTLFDLELGQAPSPVGAPEGRVGAKLNLDSSIFNQPIDQLSPDDQKAFKSAVTAAQDINRVQAAVSQGTMPGISYKAQLDNTIQAWRASHPGQETILAKVLKERGVDNYLFDEMEFQAGQLASENKAVIDLQTRQYEAGVKNLTPEEIAQFSPVQIRAFGQQLIKQESDFERKKADIDLASQMSEEERKAYNFNKEQLNEETFDALFQRGVSSLAPRLNVLSQLMTQLGEPGTNAAREQAYGNTLSLVEQQIGQIIGQTVADARPRTQQQAEALRASLKTYYETTFLDPFKNRQANFIATANVISRSMGLRLEQAMPTVIAMQKAGFNTTAIAGLFDAIPPEVKARVSRELTRAGNIDFTSPSGKILLTEMMSVMKGNPVLENGGISDPKHLLQTSVNLSVNLGKAIAGGNTEAADSYLNTLGGVVVSAGKVNRNSGTAALLNGAVAVTGNGQTRKALSILANNPTYGEEARVVLQGSRASAVNLLSGFKAQMPTMKDNFWFVKVDNNGRAVVQFDEKSWKVSQSVPQNPDFMVVPKSTVRPNPPKALLGFVGGFNSLTDHLVETNQFDPQFPKGNKQDLYRLYGADKSTPAMQAEQAKKAKAKADTDSGFFKQLQQFEQDIVSSGRPLTSGTGDSRGERNNNPGNIKDGKFTQSQPGYAGTDGTFAKFDTAEHGQQAHAALLRSNYFNKGVSTVTAIINKYAPVGGENSPEQVTNYINYVSRKLGVDPSQPLDASWASKLAQAQQEFETGNTNG